MGSEEQYQERRRVDDKHWEKIDAYIDESREYRGALKVQMKQVEENLVDLNEKFKVQNGRVNKLEAEVKYLKDLENTKKELRDSKKNFWNNVISGSIVVLFGAGLIWLVNTIINALRHPGGTNVG